MSPVKMALKSSSQTDGQNDSPDNTNVDSFRSIALRAAYGYALGRVTSVEVNRTGFVGDVCVQEIHAALG